MTVRELWYYACENGLEDNQICMNIKHINIGEDEEYEALSVAEAIDFNADTLYYSMDNKVPAIWLYNDRDVPNFEPMGW